MSVAFRRESDDEHLEPKFELPIPPGPNLVTERGLALIAARVETLEEELAGLSDETEIKRVKRDLRYWRTRQATAQVMPIPDGGVVAFGSKVTFTLNGKERTITLVGDDEADPAAGLLSFTAPLSRALMEAEVGDEIDFGGKPGAIEVLGVGA
ncbi:transcription elongation factor GreB [Novosphingobium sediminis]|uniref:Transcription elongation factor GreB n=1 Tax=Novosphingobium sediminis TaxID=707214 RepID=A0A512ANW3_9SPHN|nr:GreA/GreB family elongation factor [Novosphingobium sediminis]GEO01400.1 transcription elongation factor GreB [Novosphingobium sediminis]